MSKLNQLRGLRALVTDAVEHGSRAIEKIQKETANRPFSILEAIEPVALPAKGVHVVHDALVSLTHTAIRGVNAGVGKALDVAIDVAESSQPPKDE